MKATLILRDKKHLANGSVMEMVVWELPHPTADRPHGLKYRLYLGAAANAWRGMTTKAAKATIGTSGMRKNPTGLSRSIGYWPISCEM